MKCNYCVLLVICMFSFLSCEKENHQSGEKQKTLAYDFANGLDGWTGDFADYPVTDSLLYKLEFSRTTLPAPLNVNKYALKISGNNHSDDLFMFMKYKITGLLPNTAYKLSIDVELASKYQTNGIGAGGAMGEAVVLKAGASVVEPQKVKKNGYYFLNIDKGNQVERGKDMDTIGNAGVTDTTTVYTLIHRGNASHLFPIKTGAKGEAWVCIGTDSGFEGVTTLYFNKIELSFVSE